MKITRIGASDGNDSIVILRDLGDIPGGRTLDLTGFTGKDVSAGHIIIKKANGDYAPLGVESMAYVELSTGEEYAGVLKKSVTKKDPRAAIMTKGAVNAKALPYEVTDDIVGALNGVSFEGYAGGGPVPPAEPDYLSFTAEKAGSTLRICGYVTGDCTLTIPSFEYSTDDGATWNTWNFTNEEPDENGSYERISDTLTFENIGDKVLVRGNCPDGTAGGGPVLDSGEPGMIHCFAGGEDTEAEDNVFAVSGDLQTLVDGTGATKTAPCFAMLFIREEGMTITSAPKLTATKLSAASYMCLFGEQLYLTTPAEMGALTNASLPNVNPDTGEGAYAMVMYEETGINSMPDVSGIVLDKNSTYQDFMNVHLALCGIVAECEDVLVTSDNGKTLNGFTGIDLSEDALANYATFVGVETLSAISFSFNFFGNINGFYVALVDMLSNDENMGEVTTSDEYIPFDGTRAFWIEDGVSKDITLTASAHGGYQFSKWQTKSSESDEWTDDAEHLTSTLTFTAEPDEQYYYKAVFEAESQSQGE